MILCTLADLELVLFYWKKCIFWTKTALFKISKHSEFCYIIWGLMLLQYSKVIDIVLACSSGTFDHCAATTRMPCLTQDMTHLAWKATLKYTIIHFNVLGLTWSINPSTAFHMWRGHSSLMHSVGSSSTVVSQHHQTWSVKQSSRVSY